MYINMNNLIPISVFILSAVITWIAGVWLTRATDAIDSKFKLGSDFGGLLILGVITGLPEAAITITAAIEHNFGIVIGTLIGGIALQTVILSIFDAKMKIKNPLTFAAASLTLVLEAAMVIIVTVAAVIAIRTPVIIPGTSISMASLLILVMWLIGLWLVFKARNGLPWQVHAPEGNPGRGHHERRLVINHPTFAKASNFKIFSVLTLSAIAIIIAGYGLATTGETIATDFGINTGLFAATFIALAAALPNISTGIASINIGDYKLAISDVFGNNAFLPALFIVADIIAGRAVVQAAAANDIWFAAMGVLLTSVYIIGLIVRSKKMTLRMGYDSIIVIVLYFVGIIALSLTS